MNSTILAVDVAKSVFQVAVSRHPGSVCEERRLTRQRLLSYVAEFQPSTIVLEACGSSHHWARRFEQLGHRSILLPAHLVRPYVQRNKTDRADARGLLEAFRNRDIHPVPVKTPAHQALCSLHRLRSAWISTRTARLNLARGLLREFGITIALGARNVLPRLQALVLDPEDSELPSSLCPLLDQVAEELAELEHRIQMVEQQIRAVAGDLPEVARLRSIPGIGLLTATALVGLVVTPRRFASGRHFSSYLGLTPREYSSGLRRRLGAISKRGDTYLRMLLTHGARSVLCSASRHKQPDRLRRWALELQTRCGHNTATIALANKMARIAWAVWFKETEYRSR